MCPAVPRPANAHARIRRDAIEEIERHGWSAEGYAILSILGRESGLNISEISARSEKARGRPISDAGLQNLVVRGLVVQAETGNGAAQMQLTATGQEAVMELIAIIKAREARALEGFDPSEVQILKRLLARLVPR